MKVYDESKTHILQEYDLSKGYIKPDKRFVAHREAVEAVEEVGHYETIEEYPNGGKGVKWVVDVPAVKAKEAYDEYEDVNIYIPYTAAQLAAIEISELKKQLAATDYKAIKYAEGLISAADYAETKAQRQAWRERINALEAVQ